jgi:hypothetical protein
MDKPFEDPVFLQAVGEMTISFALLDGTLSHVLNAIEGNTDMARIAAMPYSKKVDRFIKTVKFELSELGSVNFTARDLIRLKSELKGVASRRNSLNHDFWTMANGRMTVKSLKGKGSEGQLATLVGYLEQAAFNGDQEAIERARQEVRVEIGTATH